MKQLPIISRDKKYCSGRPRVRYTRVTTSVIKGFYDAGHDVDTICKMYGLTRSQVIQAINFNRKHKLK